MISFPIVATTWTLKDKSLYEALDMIHLFGLSDVELWGEGVHVDPRGEKPDPDELAASMDRIGLAAHSIHTPFKGLALTVPDAGVRNRAVSTLSRVIELAGDVGCRFVVVHVDGSGEASGSPDAGGSAAANDDASNGASGRAAFVAKSQAVERAAAALTVLCKHAESFGITLLVENQPDATGGRFGSRVADLLELIHMVSAPNVGVCFDVAHAVVSTGDWETELRACLPYVRSVHASDTRGAEDEHLPLGDGTVDWRRVAAVLEAEAYDGGFVLEVAGGEEALERSLAHLAGGAEVDR